MLIHRISLEMDFNFLSVYHGIEPTGFRYLRKTLTQSLILLLSFLSPQIFAETIPVQKLSQAPTLDGQGDDWISIKPTKVALHSQQANSVVKAQHIFIKAGYHQDDIFFYFRWPDNKENISHKPYIWDETSNRYIRGKEREDRLAVQFNIKGDYTTDWKTGNSFTADMWHWKSSRSNPIGLAHDKSMTLSSEGLLRSAKMEGHNGPVYVLRSSDSGDNLYKSKRYSKKIKDVMPKYILNKHATGSIADIKAKGVWNEGYWHLELRRKMNTGHNDDAVFEPGIEIKGGVAVFDGSENVDHNISNTLIFQL